jgi:hypothetical protein
MTRTERTLVGTTETRLSIAVGLRDAFTARPLGRVSRVTLADRPERFVRNRSGYHVLTDLPDDVSAVTIVVDPGDRFLPERRILDGSDLESRPAVLEIDLLPAPAYRFPADATLLRGTVSEADDGQSDTPLSGVDVTVDTGTEGNGRGDADTEFTAVGRSDDDGEYVLFFRGLTGDDVRTGYEDAEDDAGRGRVVHVDGEKPVIRAIHQATDRETTDPVGIEVGETTSHDIEF